MWLDNLISYLQSLFCKFRRTEDIIVEDFETTYLFEFDREPLDSSF